MELGTSHLDSGIAASQVGNALPGVCNRGKDSLSSCRLTRPTDSPVAQAVDEQVGDLGFLGREVMQGARHVEFCTKLGPVAERAFGSVDGGANSGSVGEFERSAEIICEACLVFNGSSTQGLSCG